MSGIRPPDRRLGDVADHNRADRLGELGKIALLDGHLLENVTPNADGAVTLVPHKLARPWRGWFVVKQRYAGDEYFVTTPITPTASAVDTQEHGLGGPPDILRPALISLGTDHGYSIGDEGQLGYADSGTASRGFALRSRANETDITLSISSGGIVIINPSSAATTAIATPANWELRVHCFRHRILSEMSNKIAGADNRKYLYLKGAGFTGVDKVDIWVF